MRFKEILLIDDNRVDNFVNQFIVEKAEITKTIVVKNIPSEALDYLNDLVQSDKDFPELIFLDIKMPKMDGFEFLKEFAKFPETKSINCNVVMITSSHHPDDINNAKVNPFIKHYIIKPLDARKLEEAIKVVF